MPTIITHGIVGLAAAAKVRDLKVLKRWHLLVACAVCAMLPDLDFIGYQLGVQYNSLFGHRGFTHSLFFAAIVALIASWFLNSRARGNLSNFGKLCLLLFAVTASHALLDMMTDGGEGIALFSPFSNHRYFFPYRPIMVSPLGIAAFFNSWRGLLVLVNEFLIVIVPITIILYSTETWSWARAKKRRSAAMVVLWIISLAIFQGLYPLNNISMTQSYSEHPVIDLFVKQYKNPTVLNFIPTNDLPDKKLVTNFGEFQRRNLLNQKIESNDVNRHWASGFFPNWFGGIAGRWQDLDATLMLRTLLGYGVPDFREIQEILKESSSDPEKADYLFHLSPTEKYDLARGDYNFAVTKSVLNVTHNGFQLPKFWFGICNGMASAAKWYEEPYRTVDVINPNGFKIRFHPNDVKALLGYALANVSNWTEIGVRCTINGPEADTCRLNPGAFFLATMNRIGLAKDAFIMDGFSGTRKQFYLFDAAQVDILAGPTSVEELKTWTVPTPVKSLVKVRMKIEVVSTLMTDKVGGQSDEASGEGYYKKVGRILAPKSLDAIIALDKDGDVIGGAWMGDQDVPDVVFFPGPFPAQDKQNQLLSNSNLSWPVIREIYDQSVNANQHRAPIDFSL